ncbi:MAG: FMN-binding glutamate synthase family protein, partial [Pseudomonadota bacterium]
KYKNVAAYAKSIIKEVETIAHSCGVTEPRQLRRHHVRLVQPDGKSIRMDHLHPRPELA